MNYLEHILDFLKPVATQIISSFVVIGVAYGTFKMGFKKDENIEYIKNIKKNSIELKIIFAQLNTIRFEDSEKQRNGLYAFLFYENNGIFEIYNYQNIRKSFNEIYRDLYVIDKFEKAEDSINDISELISTMMKLNSSIEERKSFGRTVALDIMLETDGLMKIDQICSEIIAKNNDAISAVERIRKIKLR
ncbi:hypothetical protein H9L19_06345 [Weissella diestrammenae]|uniref:Uncharacterized protein n=1 Tax=Weissella diestrammenae TaxID=1162633 RepID=A0A7G9T4H7_9LACO|nr:hypothetical protein [Weissella diestrammenae]MCM0582136.1 hypothetical protein [Weissella diestrammenae]QNN75002.1 hypothetical protein H9L19_06345 [Weissella diestrammenae]